MSETLLTKEWSEYNHDYEKVCQDIRCKDGTEFMECWPNAGKWIVLSGKKHIEVRDHNVTHTRLSHSERW
jgi:hypothetical protein